METFIYYFTGTGNSLAVAKKIAGEIGNCSILPIKEELKKDLIKAAGPRTGIFFPVYFANVPPLVMEFINKAGFEKSEYIFALATSGSLAGYSFESIGRVLEVKGRRLNYSYKISMPGNYITQWYYRLANRTEGMKRSLYKRAEKIIPGIAADIIAGKDRIHRLSFFEKMLSDKFNSYTSKNNYSGWDENFHASENCVSCSVCARICPVENIVMSGGSPAWEHNCQLCMACIQQCPEQAIQYGDTTAGRKRYRHPDVSLNEIIG
ncbi:MAG: EFR1 family ferrodoxin [Brevinematales bacterium]|jgi:ferredoxin